MLLPPCSKKLNKGVENVFKIHKNVLNTVLGAMTKRQQTKKQKPRKLYQKTSPDGEPRTWLSHPKTRFYLHGSSFHVFFLFLCVFCCVFGRPLENSSFTCMGTQFWRTRSAFLRFFSFLKTQKNGPGGFLGSLGSKTPPHGPKTPPNHDVLLICVASGLICR